MKKQIVFLLMFTSFMVRAQFVDFTENVSKNKFLGLNIAKCANKANGSSNNYLKAYQCGNDTVSEYLGLNLLSPELLGQQFYIYNNFMYWMGDRYAMGKWNGKTSAAEKKIALATKQPELYFSGSGIFMIILGTNEYLQHVVAPKKTCPAGQTLVAAQLKYNDGNSIYSWSQDSMCMSPTDSFSLAITSDQDDTVSLTSAPIASSNSDANMINWLKDPGPAQHYAQATSSPRKIRIVARSSSAPVAATPQVQAGAKIAASAANNLKATSAKGV